MLCRFFTEMAMYALDVLGVVTLMPGTRRGVLGTRVRRQRLGISTLLGAAAGSNFLGNSEVCFCKAIHMLVCGLGFLQCIQPTAKDALSDDAAQTC
jgi:hypothetical protein